MQSISDALNRLHDDGSWFCRAHDVKLLSIRVGGDTRGAALKLLPMLEFHHDNRSAWVLFEDAHTRADPGWLVRSNRLVEHWGRRREAFEKEGVVLRPIDPPSVARSGPQVFRDTTAAVLRELRDPLEGLVFVLAPSLVESPSALGAELTELVGAPELARVRFVVVLDEGIAAPDQLVAALGQHALQCDCTVDGVAKDKDLATLLGTGDGNFGMAGPRGVTPPPRVDDPPPIDPAVRDAALREAGIDPRVLTESPKLRDRVLEAAVAMKDGHGAEAVRLQREARDIAASIGLLDVQVICQIALASYLCGLDQRALAVTELIDAARVAEANERPQLRSEAELALGVVYALEGQQADAAAAYARAGLAAEAAPSPTIAIEAWRMAGQLALEAGQQSPAIQSFQRAIALAEGASPDLASQSSAPEAARRLAELCRQRGLGPQAEALDAQADRFDAGPPAPGDLTTTDT